MRLQRKESNTNEKTLKPSKLIKNLSYSLENKHETVHLLDDFEVSKCSIQLIGICIIVIGTKIEIKSIILTNISA